MELAVGNRVIVLIDMDCFYVQVEQKLCPEYQNKPCSVVQYQTWKGGGIIAVNYEARAFGVKRGMRGDEAKKLCPEIHNFRVPNIREKADLSRYREAGASVIEVLCKFCDSVERASIDEAYLDLTSAVSEKMKNLEISDAHLPNTYVVGWDKDAEGDDVKSWLDSTNDDHMQNDKMLAVAAVIVEELRTAVYNETEFRCSAGIAHNKILAKLACGLHKPNKQTVMPHASVPVLYNSLPLHKVRNLGGKFGVEVKEKLNVSTMGDLAKFTEAEFRNKFGEKTGSWLFSISRGIDHEPVTARQLPKSVGCGKNFTGKNNLDTKAKVSYWLLQLATELDERLQKDQIDNRRFARSLNVSIRTKGDTDFNAISRTCPIHVYNAQKIASDALKAIQKLNTVSATSLLWNPPVVNLTLAASKFEDQVSLASHGIHSYFTASESFPDTSKENDSNLNHVIDLISEEKSKDGENADLLLSSNKKLKTIHRYFVKNNDLNAEQKILEKTFNPSNKKKTSELPSTVSALFADVNSPKSDNANQNETISNKKSTIGSFFAKREQDKVLLGQVGICDKNSASENVFINKSSDHLNKTGDVLDTHFTSDVEKVNNNKTSTSTAIEPVENNDMAENTSHLPYNLSEIASSSTSGVTYATSELPLELIMSCSKCNKNIPVWEEQEHSDYHIAMDIQNEFPNKVRNAISVSKQKSEVKKGSSKTSKQKNKISKQAKLNTIDKFMK